ncbi:MAG: hypothetical protein R3246_15515, partial [Acidimicrobiia bacterium]|nr:hypothetical protein [Acidimicrobiia bacterium]
MLRDRSNIFFVFIFPLALVLLIGAQFGAGFTPRLGLHDADGGDVTGTIVDLLDEEVDITRYETEEDLTLAVERGMVAAGLSFPAETTSRLQQGEQVELGFVATTDGAGPQLQALVTETIAAATESVGVGQFVAGQGLADYETGVAVADQVGPSIGTIAVDTRTTGEQLFPNLGQFDLGASSQLLLF